MGKPGIPRGIATPVVVVVNANMDEVKVEVNRGELPRRSVSIKRVIEEGRPITLLQPRFSWDRLFARAATGVPDLHALRVKNRGSIVNNYLSTLTIRRYIRRREYRFRRLPGRNGCLIFHHSIRDIGEFVEAKSLEGKHFHDWEQIFAGVPRGFGRELLIDYDTVKTAIWQGEHEGKGQIGEYRVVPIGSKNSGRGVLFHETLRPPALRTESS